MHQNEKSSKRITIVGRAREQYDRIGNDRFRLCQMEISTPYPHVAFFSIEARDGCGISEIIGQMEDADEVSIDFELQEESDGFDELSPALSTTPDRITITKP